MYIGFASPYLCKILCKLIYKNQQQGNRELILSAYAYEQARSQVNTEVIGRPALS